MNRMIFFAFLLVESKTASCREPITRRRSNGKSSDARVKFFFYKFSQRPLPAEPRQHASFLPQATQSIGGRTASPPWREGCFRPSWRSIGPTSGQCGRKFLVRFFRRIAVADLQRWLFCRATSSPIPFSAKSSSSFICGREKVASSPEDWTSTY